MTQGLVNLEELSAILDVSEAEILTLAKAGKIPNNTTSQGVYSFPLDGVVAALREINFKPEAKPPVPAVAAPPPLPAAPAVEEPKPEPPQQKAGRVMGPSSPVDIPKTKPLVSKKKRGK